MADRETASGEWMLQSGWIYGAALFASALAGEVLAQEFQFLKMDGHLVKWERPVLGTGATVTYALVDRISTFPGARNCGAIKPLKLYSRRKEIPRESIARELRKALAAWSSVANVTFVRARSDDRADILIGVQAVPRGRAFANVTPHTRDSVGSAFSDNHGAEHARGQARRPAGVRSLGSSLICLNPNVPWKIGFDGDTGVYDLRYTFMHEIGHVLGLNHAGPAGSVMSYRYEEAFPGLQPGDIAGVVRLYGPKTQRSRAR